MKTSFLIVPKPGIGAISAKCPPGPTGTPFLNGLDTDLDAVWLEVCLDFGGCLSESGPVSLSSCFNLLAVLLDSNERAVLRRLRPALPRLLRLPIFSSIYTQRTSSTSSMYARTDVSMSGTTRRAFESRMDSRNDRRCIDADEDMRPWCTNAPKNAQRNPSKSQMSPTHRLVYLRPAPRVIDENNPAPRSDDFS